MFMDLQQHFSDNMNKLHQIHDNTLEEFAKELCISRSSLQQMLKGPYNPRLDTVEQIAAHLGVEPLALLSDPGSLLHMNGPFAKLFNSLSDEDKRELISHVHAIMKILAKCGPPGEKE